MGISLSKEALKTDFEGEIMPDFSEIYGNELVIKNLQNAIAYKHVSHCYMISGAEGLGKRTIAKAFAKNIQCECEEEVRRPCGKCASCIQVEHENHPDVVYVKHEKPTVFSVDDIREGLNRHIVIKPYKSEKKIYILEDGELLNVSAQNAMLKTIEEPPEYAVVLILTNNKEAFLPTIRSRCVEFSLQPVRDQDVLNCLKKRGFSAETEEETILRFARGNIGRAIAFFEDEECQKLMTSVQEVLYRLPDADNGGIRQIVEQLSVYKDRMELVIEQIRLWYRDVFLCKTGYPPKHEGVSAEYIKEQSKRYAYEEMPRILKEIENFQNRLKVNVNLELSMEVMFFGLQPSDN